MTAVSALASNGSPPSTPSAMPATPATVPRIASGFRLQWEPVQNCHVLLYPEGMVKLNTSAGEIMKRCDGERCIAEIARELELAFNAPALEADVIAFVDMAGQQRWLAWN